MLQYRVYCRIPKNSKNKNVTYQSKMLKFQRIPKNSKVITPLFLSIIILLLLNFLSICLCHQKSTFYSLFKKYYIDDDCWFFPLRGVPHIQSLTISFNMPTETKRLWFSCFNIPHAAKVFLQHKLLFNSFILFNNLEKGLIGQC